MVSEGDNYQLPGGVFLIQKEVGEKIMTAATKKSYLRWLLNNQYDVFYEFTVPPQAFTPPPKVDSAVVSFVRKDKPILMKNDDLQKMRRVLDIISPYKRKTLGKIQKLCGSSINIPTYLWSRRLEELGWNEMKEILGTN
jgi:16S rRNA (adenine1518-N6/adenine1519-N6)-dimethyltransferase